MSSYKLKGMVEGAVEVPFTEMLNFAGSVIANLYPPGEGPASHELASAIVTASAEIVASIEAENAAERAARQ